MNDTLAKLLTDDESVYEPTRLPEVFAYLAGLRDRLFAAASAAEKEPLGGFGGISDSPLTSETADEEGWYDDPEKLPETIRQIVLLRRAVKEAK